MDRAHLWVVMTLVRSGVGTAKVKVRPVVHIPHKDTLSLGQHNGAWCVVMGTVFVLPFDVLHDQSAVTRSDVVRAAVITLQGTVQLPGRLPLTLCCVVEDASPACNWLVVCNQAALRHCSATNA